LNGDAIATCLRAGGRSGSVRELGVGVNLLPHASRELAALGVLDTLTRAAIPTLELLYTNRFGQVIWREPRGVDAGHDHPQLSIHRGRLQGGKGACQLHERALAGCRRVLGDDHPNTLTAMSHVAETNREMGDLQLARELHEQALAARRRVLRRDHPDILKSMNNLAETRRALGDLRGAHQLHEQTLAARQRVLGEDHPDTLISMNKLAETRQELEEKL
jgi:Tetratricopeptide repeat